MKIAALLILLKLFIFDIFCNDDILTKFHQNVFKLRELRLEAVRYNEEYFNSFEVKTFKYNRTTAAINGSINMKVTVKDKVEILVKAFKFLSNEYRRFPVRFQINLRKAAEHNIIGMNAIKNCGNIKIMSFEKDVTYYFCNFVADETCFPPLIPNGRYKVDIKLLYLNEEIALVSAFGEVYIPIKYPKK